MTTPNDVRNIIGRTAVDSQGAKLGKIGQVYLDDQTGQPLWVTVATGLFGTKQSFAPIYGSQSSGDQVQLAVTKDLIKDAPNVEDDGQIDESEQDALYRHYADYLGTGQTSGQTTYTDSGDAGYVEGRDAEYVGTDDVRERDTSGSMTDDAMTRSEERLRVGTESVETGRARLRKYIVTENVTTTVPVSREEVRVVREPITDANRDAAMSGGELTEEEHEVTLRAERPVVAKETVPVERVRLETETVTDNVEVTETVRKEQFEEPEVDGTTRDTTRRDTGR